MEWIYMHLGAARGAKRQGGKGMGQNMQSGNTGGQRKTISRKSEVQEKGGQEMHGMGEPCHVLERALGRPSKAAEMARPLGSNPASWKLFKEIFAEPVAE
eukprot:2921103-Pyramimonas_sp.AAC.1